MPYSALYRESEPSRSEVDQLSGLVLLEFGASWCGHCLAVEPVVKELLSARPDVQHLRIADGRGKPLGRSFRVKLWPTFILMRDGVEIAQLVRPDAQELKNLLTGRMN